MSRWTHVAVVGIIGSAIGLERAPNGGMGSHQSTLV